MLLMKYMKKAACCTALLLLLCSLSACGEAAGSMEKVRDLDFTVVQENELPEQLATIINEKKTNPFKLTYTNAEYLYIAQGYGAQPTGGYSVTIKEMFLSSEGICFASELLGPGENEEVAQMMTYPCVVIKTELLDEPVLFR